MILSFNYRPNVLDFHSRNSNDFEVSNKIGNRNTFQVLKKFSIITIQAMTMYLVYTCIQSYRFE